MPINEQAARIGNGKQVQPAQGKTRAGIVTVWDGNFSNNYDGAVNCRGASRINYGEGETVEYVNQPDMTPDDPDAQVDGVCEYGYGPGQ
jgi:hypothetical protein